jgi:hypothetical protein
MPTAQGLLLAATVAFVSGGVEHSSSRGRGPADAGASLAAGDGVLTREDGLVRVDLEGMVLTVGASSVLRLEGARAVLESGRVEVASEGQAIVIATAEAEAHGGGRLVVRRAGKRTHLLALEGRFRVRAGRRGAMLAAGRGLAVSAAGLPEPGPLADAPAVVAPSADPFYVRAGEPVSLSWTPPGPVHLQVLPFEAPEAVLARDVERSPAQVSLKVPGLYRWRVSRRGADGGEGLPSTEGLISVVDGP